MRELSDSSHTVIIVGPHGESFEDHIREDPTDMDTSPHTDLSPAEACPVESIVLGPTDRRACRFRWWMPSLTVVVLSASLVVYAAGTGSGDGWFEVRSAGWWVFTCAVHLPYFVTLVFLVVGLLERFGFYWKGRAPERPGTLPPVYPSVCVQLPMFNEHAVARRII